MSPYLRVVPLFETLDDLQYAETAMRQLFSNEWYRNHIDGQQVRAVGAIFLGGECLQQLHRSHVTGQQGASKRRLCSRQRSCVCAICWQGSTCRHVRQLLLSLCLIHFPARLCSMRVFRSA